jgi:hypothetical protein
MSGALGLALLTLLAPLGAATLAVVIPPLRRRGTPAAGLTVASSVMAAGAALALLRLGPGPGAAASLSVPWMVVQGRPLGQIGVRLDGVSVLMLAALCLAGSPGLLAELSQGGGARRPLRAVLHLPRAVPLQHEHPGPRSLSCSRRLRRLGAGGVFAQLPPHRLPRGASPPRAGPRSRPSG